MSATVDALFPAATLRPLPYVAHLAPRERSGVHRIVLHCTELPDLATAREYGERVHYADRTGNSGHYYIDRDGRSECWVPVERVAHHCRGQNPGSVGIELVNRGRYPDWLYSGHQTMSEPYPPAQIEALIALLTALAAVLPIQDIAGHEDLDTTEVPAEDDPSVRVRRKRDPGPLFPWDAVLAATGLTRHPPA